MLRVHFGFVYFFYSATDYELTREGLARIMGN
jgi:hypothetical protein